MFTGASGEPEALYLAAMFGLLYGFVCYGTPLLPRRSLPLFLQVTGTSELVLSFWRNIGDPAAPFSRMLPVIIWNLAITGGAAIHSFVEFRWSARDMFYLDTENVANSEQAQLKENK